MPKENDLEGQQDMAGKHGGQAGMPKPEDGAQPSRASCGTKSDRSDRQTRSELSTLAGKTEVTPWRSEAAI